AIEIEETIAWSRAGHGRGRSRSYRPREARSPTARTATITAIHAGESGRKAGVKLWGKRVRSVNDSVKQSTTRRASTATATPTTAAGSARTTSGASMERVQGHGRARAATLTSLNATSALTRAPHSRPEWNRNRIEEPCR